MDLLNVLSFKQVFLCFNTREIIEKQRKVKEIIKDYQYKKYIDNYDLIECIQLNLFTAKEIESTLPEYMRKLKEDLLSDNTEFWKDYLKANRRLYKINKAKLKAKILAFSQLNESKKQMYFWTITFPAGTADDLCFKLFNIWLTRCRKLQNLKSYIWVAERQKIGTIHFHLLINSRMNIKESNRYMRESLLNIYEKDKNAFGTYNPQNYNGVDIDKNRKTKQIINFARGGNIKILSQYLTKYVSKNNEQYAHAPNHYSRDVSALFTHVTLSNLELCEIAEKYNIQLHFVSDNEFFSYYSFTEEAPQKIFETLHTTNNIIYDSFT